MNETYREKSFWLATAGDYQPSPPLAGQVKLDVAIVGGGFTGLSTALALKTAQPGLEVGILESQVIGFGGSGRNAGFAMTTFGLSTTVTKMLHGRDKARDALAFAERAVDHLGAMVERYKLQCDYEDVGFLRVATHPGYVKRCQQEIELVQGLGFEGFEWLDAEATRARADSPTYLGAIWEPRMALVNPAKLAWELKRVNLGLGVKFFEKTPVRKIEQNGSIRLSCPGGVVSTDKLVLAAGSFSNLLAPTRGKQHPAFTHIVLTEPLSQEQLGQIGWQGREGLEDARNLLHYYRLTADNRLLVGGGAAGITYGDDMDLDRHPPTFEALERFITRTFPQLAGTKIEHRWGGPVSVPVDMVPAMGYLGDRKAVYALGYVGHGVSISHLVAEVLKDLVLEQDSELSRHWFVNRKTLPWPPEPFAYVVAHLMRAALTAEDWWYER
ncbi:MAG: FAD-dependent oxidoreductase [Candidatus Eremiobacteraeota bacterium]|nr:FAD-dependent oxidoreductase [Candidatus Eremiobacteraeota bacterium]